MQKKGSIKRRGFSFLELMVTLAVMGILFLASSPIYGNLLTANQLSESRNQIVQTIRTAQRRAISGYYNSEHGVHFTDSDYTLYQGSSFSGRNVAFDQTIVLEQPLSINTTLSSDDINFSKGLGEPSNTGEIVLTHDIQGSETITINSLGKVE